MAGASAIIISALIYQNVMVPRETELVELEHAGAQLDLQGILKCWQVKMNGHADDTIRATIMPHVTSECCDADKLGRCYGNFRNALGMHASAIASQDYNRGLKNGLGSNQRSASGMLRGLENSGVLNDEVRRLFECMSGACTTGFWRE